MNRLIIDVREPEEFELGLIDGAINIPPSQLISWAPQLKNISKDIELILYCVSGSRSNEAIQLLKSRGFSNVINGIKQDHIKKNYVLV